MKWWAMLALWLAALVPARSEAAGSAPAEVSAPTVVLLVAQPQDAMTAAAAARVQGELAAAGFHISIVPLGGHDARRDLETAGSELRPIAAFAIFVTTPDQHGDAVAEIWVSDRIHQRVVIQRADLSASERDRGAEILAVRAVELLRANLAEFWLPSAPAPRPPEPVPPPLVIKPSAPPHDAAPANPRQDSFAAGLGASLGLAVFQNFDRGSTAWAPVAMISYGFGSEWIARAAFYTTATSDTVAAPGGTARIDQQFVLLDAVKTWWPNARAIPFVSAGAGAAHLQASGHGTPPNTGKTADAWSLLTTAGLGIAIPFAKHLSAVAQARAAVTWPPNDLMIAGADAGRVGSPSLLLDANVLATLP